MFTGALKSKTIWFGTALLVAEEVLNFMPAFQDAIPSETYGLILKGIGLAIIILRIVTTQPLSEK